MGEGGSGLGPRCVQQDTHLAPGGMGRSDSIAIEPHSFSTIMHSQKGYKGPNGLIAVNDMLILLQPDRRITLHKVQIHLMPQQLPNILDAVLDHRRSLQTQTPTIDPHIRRQTHRLQHLRSEHAAVANLYPLIQPFMEAENLHAGFGIRVVGGLETQAVDPHFREEDFHEAYESSQGQAVVGNDSFDLVEFCEMRSVDALVTEDAIYREVACGAGIGGEFVENVG